MLIIERRQSLCEADQVRSPHSTVGKCGNTIGMVDKKPRSCVIYIQALVLMR